MYTRRPQGRPSSGLPVCRAQEERPGGRSPDHPCSLAGEDKIWPSSHAWERTDLTRMAKGPRSSHARAHACPSSMYHHTQGSRAPGTPSSHHHRSWRTPSSWTRGRAPMGTLHLQLQSIPAHERRQEEDPSMGYGRGRKVAELRSSSKNPSSPPQPSSGKRTAKRPYGRAPMEARHNEDNRQQAARGLISHAWKKAEDRRHEGGRAPPFHEQQAEHKPEGRSPKMAELGCAYPTAKLERA
ncbi:hypothetical protein Dimus_010354 [Dionaea muscipula]